MNYDDVVERSKRVKAPSPETEAGAASETIISALENVDRRTRVSIRVLQGLFVFLILFALGFIVVNDDTVTRSGVGFLVLSFLVVIYMQQLRYRAYNETYLGEPIVEYLRRAKNRMRVFTVRSWLAIPAWLLIDVGICLLIYAASDRFDIPVGYVILGLQVPIVMAAAADFLVEYLIWRKEHKPIITKIDGLLDDIETSLG
jgi:membrane protein YdbS with pleckstrin-like domain